MELRLIGCMMLLVMGANAQHTLTKKWDKRFGGLDVDIMLDLVQSNRSGFLLCGSSLSGIGGNKTQPNWDTTLATSDIWIVKIDSLGNKEWDKRFGGSKGDGISDVIPTIDGGYLLGGITNSGLSGDKSQDSRGGDDYWIVKIDSIGNKLWDKRFGGSSDDDLGTLLQTNDHGFILGGSSMSGIGGDKTEDNRGGTGFTDDYWIVKIDSLGNKQWDKRFGGDQEDAFWSMDRTNDGGYILAGNSSSGISGDKSVLDIGLGGTYRCWVVKIDSLGNKQWDKIVPNGVDLYFIKQRPNGVYIMVGTIDSLNQNDSILNHGYGLVQFDSLGNKQWLRVFNEAYEFHPYDSFSFTNDGGYLLGVASANVKGGNKSENNLGPIQTWVIKTDSIGRKEWDKTILTKGSDNSGYAVQCKDGNYLIGNFTTSPIGGYKTQDDWGTGLDYWVIKMNDTIISGIEDISEPINVSVYPNPFSSEVSILLQKQNLEQASFCITDLLGKCIYQQDETNLADHYTKMLDLSHLPNGIYILEVIIDNERIVKKLVKQ